MSVELLVSLNARFSNPCEMKCLVRGLRRILACRLVRCDPEVFGWVVLGGAGCLDDAVNKSWVCQ